MFTGLTPAALAVACGFPSLLAVAMFLMWLRRARRRAATETPEKRRVRRVKSALFALGLLFSCALLAAFGIGTYEGGVVFAGRYFDWYDWRNVVPWAASDLGAVGFSFFAMLRAYSKRDPYSAMQVAKLCAMFSAVMQLTSGGQKHVWQAGLALAIIALLGARVLHEVLWILIGDDEDQWVGKRKHLRFGSRWGWAFPSTVTASRRWKVYPPGDDVPVTVKAALEHSERIGEMLAAKRAARAERSGALGALRFLPVLARTSTVRALTEQLRERSERDAEQMRAEVRAAAELLAKVEDERARAREASTQASTELDALRARAEQAEHAAAHARAEALRVGEQWAEHVRSLQDEHEASIGALRSALARAEQASTDARHSERSPEQSARTGPVSDEDAVQAMLDHTRSPSYAWTYREVASTASVGQPRAKKLMERWAEHVAQGTNADGGPYRSTAERSAEHGRSTARSARPSTGGDGAEHPPSTPPSTVGEHANGHAPVLAGAPRSTPLG